MVTKFEPRALIPVNCYKMLNPLVSIIIPAFNAEKFVCEALESVFTQSYGPIEVIVVDDGSTDKTAEVVKSYQTRRINKERLIFIHQQNAGPSAARNAGINVAKSKYIAFLDSDDIWTKDKLLRQIQLMETHPDTGLLFGDTRRFSRDNILISSLFEQKGYDLDFFGENFYLKHAYNKILTNGNFITTGTVILKRKCLEHVGYFDENLRYSEDMDLWLRIAVRYPIAYSTDLYMLRRIHEHNVSENIEAMYLGFITVMQKHWEHYPDAIRQNEIKISKLYQKKYYELGYVFFSKNEFRKARSYFAKSLFHGLHLRSLSYLLLTCLGQKFLDKARNAKNLLLRQQ